MRRVIDDQDVRETNDVCVVGRRPLGLPAKHVPLSPRLGAQNRHVNLRRWTSPVVSVVLVGDMDWERCPLCDSPWIARRCDACGVVLLSRDGDDPRLAGAREAFAVGPAGRAPAALAFAETVPAVLADGS
jgi:hypothetical protein